MIPQSIALTITPQGHPLLQDDQLEPIYNRSGPIQDIALKTSQEQWTIEMSDEGESGKSMLATWHDYDDDEIYQ